MLDIKAIRRDPEGIKKRLKTRGVDPLIVDEVLALDFELRKMKTERDDLRRQKKAESLEHYRNDIFNDGWRN